MRAARSFRQLVALAALVAASLLSVSCAHAQTSTIYNLNTWKYVPLLNDTCSIGMQKTSLLLDMSKFRYATLKVKINSPSGAAIPWSLVRIRACASTGANPDTTNNGLLQLQPIADHSYIGSAAGDSLGYGSWVQGNAVTAGNGDILIRAQVPNSKWTDPSNAWFFALGNKGQEARLQYLYFQVAVLAAGGAGPTRVQVGAVQSN